MNSTINLITKNKTNVHALSNLLPKNSVNNVKSLLSAGAMFSLVLSGGDQKANAAEPVINNSNTRNNVQSAVTPVVARGFERLQTSVARSPEEAGTLINNFLKVLTDKSDVYALSIAAQLNQENPKVLIKLLVAIAKLENNESPEIRAVDKSQLDPLHILQTDLKRTNGNIDNLDSGIINQVVASIINPENSTRLTDALDIGKVGILYQTLVLDDTVQLVSSQVPRVNAVMDLPHIHQGSGTLFCGSSASLMSLQQSLGLALSDSILSQIAGLVRERSETGERGTAPRRILPLIGLKSESINYAEKQNISNRADAVKLAREVLENSIVDKVKQGMHVILTIETGPNFGHCLLLRGYDENNKTFIISDPLANGSSNISLEELATKFPLSYENVNSGYYNLYADIVLGVNSNTFLLPPRQATLELPENINQSLSTRRTDLSNIRVLNSVDRSLNWINIARAWEEDRDPSTVLGLGIIANLHVAAGRPVLAVVCGEREGEHKIVAVTGYRGEYNSPDCQMLLTYGDKTTKVVTPAEFATMCAIKDPLGRTAVYICYTEPSIEGAEINPIFPRLRSGQSLFQRPSPQKQIPSNQYSDQMPHVEWCHGADYPG